MDKDQFGSFFGTKTFRTFLTLHPPEGRSVRLAVQAASDSNKFGELRATSGWARWMIVEQICTTRKIRVLDGSLSLEILRASDPLWRRNL